MLAKQTNQPFSLFKPSCLVGVLSKLFKTRPTYPYTSNLTSPVIRTYLWHTVGDVCFIQTLGFLMLKVFPDWSDTTVWNEEGVSHHSTPDWLQRGRDEFENRKATSAPTLHPNKSLAHEYLHLQIKHRTPAAELWLIEYTVALIYQSWFYRYIDCISSHTNYII